MKKNLRFYFALFFAKGTALVLKLIGRKGTSMPGSWAIILCPDFIGRIDKPKTIIGITGTNGKTTVSNLIEDVLTAKGQDYICNKEGSNVPTGIASTLIANSTLFGRQKKQMAVLEIDERSTVRIFPYLTPDILIVTNLFRDSSHRNAHTEFIFDILNKYIPKETKLILNGDDPLCARLRGDGERLFFGMLPQPFEKEAGESLVCDNAVCPKCMAPLTYDFKRYHHIGIAHCDACGYTFPERDYLIEAADREAGTLDVSLKGTKQTLRLLDKNPINMYNQLCAAAMLTELGYGPGEVTAAFESLKITETRLATLKAGDKTIVRFLAKGQNPVACSRAFDIARSLEGQKCVILFIDELYTARFTVEDTSYRYDADYEFLNDPSINQIVVAGDRYEDSRVRLLMAGIPAEKIFGCKDYDEALTLVDYDKSDVFAMFFDNYLMDYAEKAEQRMAEQARAAKKAPLPEAAMELPVIDRTLPAGQAPIRVEVLFPAVCKLFGDLANIRYLKACMPWAEFIETGLNDKPRFLSEDINLVYMAPMTEHTQEEVIARLLPYKEQIQAKIHGGTPLLFTGNALEVLGNYIETDEGKKIAGLGIFDLWAKQKLFQRHFSEFEGDFMGKSILGFKTQFTMCYPTGQLESLFPVTKGIGMNFESKAEGIRVKNFMGTYVIGPLLVMNPAFTRYLLDLIGAKNCPLAFAEAVETAYQIRKEDFDKKVSKEAEKYKYM